MYKLILLLLIACISIVIAFFFLRSKDNKTAKTTGKVVKITPVFKANSKIEFEYTFEGIHYRSFTLSNDQFRFEINDSYEIHVNPSKPTEAKLTTNKAKH